MSNTPNIGKVFDLTNPSSSPKDSVTSFNGRKGDVTPQSGDYTPEMVGAASSNHTHPAYGICDTPTNTVDKLVTLPGFSLATGARITVKFVYGVNRGNLTLNVNGAGAKPIVMYDSTPMENISQPNSVVEFVYDGTSWIVVDGYVRWLLSHAVLDIDNIFDHLDSLLPLAGGTMTGALTAKDDTAYTTSKVRNVKFGTSDLTANSTSLSSGSVALIYE